MCIRDSLMPATPRTFSKTKWSPSSTRTLALASSEQICLLDAPSWSWLPSTATQGMRSAVRSSASVRASSGVPRSVRSPHNRSRSATSFTCLTKFRNRPCWSSRQWRSPDAATRILIFGSRATDDSSLLLVPFPTAGVPPAVDVEPVVDPGHEVSPADALLLGPGLQGLHRAREEPGHHPVRHLSLIHI